MLVTVIPHQLCAHFHAGDRVNHHNGRICHLQRRFDLADKIGETGSIQQINLVLFVLAGHQRGADGHFAVALFVLKVGHGGAILHPPQARGGAAGVQHCLHQRGLPRPAVPDKDNIADAIGRMFFHQMLRQPPSRKKRHTVARGQMGLLAQVRIVTEGWDVVKAC